MKSEKPTSAATDEDRAEQWLRPRGLGIAGATWATALDSDPPMGTGVVKLLALYGKKIEEAAHADRAELRTALTVAKEALEGLLKKGQDLGFHGKHMIGAHPECLTCQAVIEAEVALAKIREVMP